MPKPAFLSALRRALRPLPLALPTVTLLTLTLLPPCSWAAIDSPEALRAASLAANCASCHGTAGLAQPGGSIAPLAGTPQAALLTRLQEFRSGKRAATVMHQITRGYTEAQLASLAAYFSALPAPVPALPAAQAAAVPPGTRPAVAPAPKP